MSVDEGHVNQAEFPEAAVQQAKEEYSADSDSFGEKDPFKLKKDKKELEKKKKERGYKTFEPEAYSEEDDERGKGKKRGSSLFRFPAKTKPKDKPPTPRGGDDARDSKGADERRPSKDKIKEEKKTKGGGGGVEEKAKWRTSLTDDKRRTKSKEREEKKSKKKSASMDFLVVKKPEPVFGVPLYEAVSKTKLYDNVELPRVVRECIDYVEQFGLMTPGIYRLSGVKSKVEALKFQYDNSDRVNLADYDPTIITSLLKQYLRELPESVLTARLMPAFEHSAALSTKEEKVSAFKKVLAQLPKCNFTLLSWMMVHLGHVLQRKEQTKMTIQNLSIVMSPSMRISHRTLNILFIHWEDLFGHVKIKKCPKPLEWIPGSVFEMPETTAELEEELLRHEAILANMHDELNQGIADKSTEDDLWEVQRVVTQLKRKLRVSRRVSETRIAEKEKQDPKSPAKEPLPPSKDPRSPTKDARSPAKTVSLPPSAVKVEIHKQKDENQEDTKEDKKEVAEVKTSQPPSDVKAEVDKKGSTEEKDKEKDETEKEEEPEKIDRRTESEEEKEKEKIAEQDLEMMKLLLLSQAEVVAEREELMNIRNDLQKRIEAEREEISRLQSAILEAQQSARRRGASVDSLDSSATETSSSESEDEEELQKILEGLIRENEELRRKNMQLSYNIHNERESCAELRVQIKLAEQMPQLIETLEQVGLKGELRKDRSVSERAHFKSRDVSSENDKSKFEEASLGQKSELKDEALDERLEAKVGLSVAKTENEETEKQENGKEQQTEQSQVKASSKETNGIKTLMQMEAKETIQSDVDSNNESKVAKSDFEDSNSGAKVGVKNENTNTNANPSSGEGNVAKDREKKEKKVTKKRAPAPPKYLEETAL